MILDPDGWKIAKDISQRAVEQAVEQYAPAVAEECDALGLDPRRLMLALADVESRRGRYLDAQTWKIATRHEPSYSRGGRYYDKNLSAHWGKAAECSYGPWQIMYSNAYRMGFPVEVDPLDAEDGLVNVRVAAEMSSLFLAHELRRVITYRHQHPLDTRDALQMVACVWNSGSPDGTPVKHYVARLRSAYDSIR